MFINPLKQVSQPRYGTQMLSPYRGKNTFMYCDMATLSLMKAVLLYKKFLTLYNI